MKEVRGRLPALGGAAFVLLIGAVNVANWCWREPPCGAGVRHRVALGAGTGRLMGQLVTESIGGPGGGVAGAALAGLLRALARSGIETLRPPARSVWMAWWCCPCR